MFFEKSGPVWETLHALEQRLETAGIDYVVIGGLALNAYHYPRQTVDVDVVLTREGYEAFKAQYRGTVYRPAPSKGRRVIDSDTEISVDILIAGELAGRRSKNTAIRFPEPAEAEVHGDLRTVSLARLIELKLVTWRYKDWGDVVELIRRNDLAASFADQLHPLVRTAFGECWDQANEPEYDRG